MTEPDTTQAAENHSVTTLAQLEAIYGKPVDRSLWKEIDFLNEDYQAFVRASPFIVLASVGAGGTDCSAKGDPPGFVQIIDDRTIAIPDRPGNNRIDHLRNFIADPRVSVLFMVPGIGETLRVNGHAGISIDPHLLGRFQMRGRLPRTVIVVRVESAYFHCSKALVRSDLWNPASRVERSRLPSAGQMLRTVTGGNFDAESYDEEAPGRIQAGLY